MTDGLTRSGMKTTYHLRISWAVSRGHRRATLRSLPAKRLQQQQQQQQHAADQLAGLRPHQHFINAIHSLKQDNTSLQQLVHFCLSWCNQCCLLVLVQIKLNVTQLLLWEHYLGMFDITGRGCSGDGWETLFWPVVAGWCSRAFRS